MAIEGGQHKLPILLREFILHAEKKLCTLNQTAAFDSLACRDGAGARGEFLNAGAELSNALFNRQKGLAGDLLTPPFFTLNHLEPTADVCLGFR